MKKLNPNHQSQKSFLKTMGPLILIVGLGFMAVGLISFFSSFGSFGPPKYFWCCFVGMPLMGIGIAMIKFAYIGTIARYSAGEIAPVAKDTFNYVAKGSAEGVSAIVQAIKKGPEEEEGDSIEDRINKLKKLKDEGVINDEDFEEQKDRILSEL